MWEWIASTPHNEGPVLQVHDRRFVPAQPNANRDWDSTLRCLNRVGRPSGEGEFLRPEGEFIVDFAKDPHGWSIVECAHAMAHLRMLAGDETDGSSLMLEAVAAIAFCRIFGTRLIPPPLDLGGWHGFVPGIRFSTSVAMRRPWLSVPRQELRPDGPLLHVLVGIHLEPQPWSAREGNPDDSDERWLEMNRWSCMPSMACVSGFAFSDEAAIAPLVGRWRNSGPEDSSHMLPATALHGPSDLPDVLDRMGFRRDWSAVLPSEAWFARAVSTTPPLPCRECLRLNMAAEGSPTRPAKRRPDDGRDPEWEEYDRKVDKILRVVDRACSFHDMRAFPGFGKRLRKERARRAKAASALVKTRRGLLDRADKARKNMRLSAALEFETLATQKTRELESLVNQPITTQTQPTQPTQQEKHHG